MSETTNAANPTCACGQPAKHLFSDARVMCEPRCTACASKGMGAAIRAHRLACMTPFPPEAVHA